MNAQVLLQVMFVFEGLGAFCTLKLSVSARLRNSPLRKETGKRLFLQRSLSQHMTVNKSSVSFPLQRCEHQERCECCLYLLSDVSVCGHVTDELRSVGEAVATEGTAVVVIALFMP